MLSSHPCKQSSCPLFAQSDRHVTHLIASRSTGNVLNAPQNFPVAPHAAMLNGSVKAWHDMTSKWNAAGLPYIPNLSVQWDSSPRTVVSDTFQLGGYPFTGTFRSTPEEWTNALRAGKQFLDGTCKSDGTWCPMTINAWNEVCLAWALHTT